MKKCEHKWEYETWENKRTCISCGKVEKIKSKKAV